MREGKVARVLNAQEVAITLGKQDGVRRGMIFQILLRRPDLEVTEPESGEVLGVLAQVQIRVQVIQVETRFAVCSTRPLLVPATECFPSLLFLKVPARGMAYIPQDHTADENFVQVGDRVKLEEPDEPSKRR